MALKNCMEPIEAAEELSACKGAKGVRAFRFQGMFAALSHRNYRLFFFGQIVSLIGTWMNNTAEGWLVYQITGSKALLGVVAAASTAPMLFLATLGGWLADHRPKRSILVVTQAVSMVISLVLAFLVWHGAVRPWQLIALAALGGVVMAFDMPARQSFIIEMTNRENLVNAIALNSAVFNGARVVGPSVAGLLMANVGIAMCFFLDGISFIAVIAGLLLMRLAPHRSPERRETVFAGAISGFRYVWNTPRLRRIFFLFGVVGVFGWSYAVLMPAIARDVLKVSEASYGLLLAASGLGALCGALAVAAAGQNVHPRKLALGGTWLFSASIACFAFMRVLWPAMICLALAGFGLLLFFSSANSAVQTSVSDDMRGRVMGIWALAFGGAVPLGGLEAGTMAHYYGAPATIVLGAAICAIAAFATFVASKRAEAGEQAIPS